MTPEEMLKECLVLDIECYSDKDINKENDAYLRDAKIKWIGFYSYRSEEYYKMQFQKNTGLIQEFINQHKYLVSFNGLAFDIPILKNNGIDLGKFYYTSQIDMQVVLGNDIFHKARGNLMGYKFRKNSLAEMAIAMKLPVLKDEIDYTIFEKDVWTEEETIKIKKYLHADIEVTKLMFDKVFNYWRPFADFVSQKNVENWSWITSSIASLVYKSMCHIMNWKEEYGEKGPKTDGGGRVIEPKGLEFWKVYYADVRSLYPHIEAMFNLFCEVLNTHPGAWHGNEVFKVNGYYDITSMHPLAVDAMHKLKSRIAMKQLAKQTGEYNPLEHAYKIYLNTMYGVARSQVFVNAYTPNNGEDCCYLGRQINRLMEKMMAEKGYTTIAGDTDSVFIQHKDDKTREQVKADLGEVVKFINKHCPFPQETFDIEIENYLDYIMFVKSEKKTNKKNYCYIYEKNGEKKVTIMGLPIKKVNATKLGPHIFKTHIEPRMKQEIRGKFDAVWVEKLIHEEFAKDITLMAQEKKAKPYEKYVGAGKHSNPARVSKAYLDGKGGTISLIKNTRVGKIGTTYKYCTIEEAKKYNLQPHEVDLEKVYNELSPFVKGGLDYKKRKKLRNDIKSYFNSPNTNTTSVPEIKGGFFE